MRGFGATADRQSAARVCAAVASFALAGPCLAAADIPGNARILYFEPFVTTIDPRPALSEKRSNARMLKFDAYGRRFELALEPNATLEPARAGSNVQLYRGELTGIAGSWARVATSGSDVHGLIWDGSQLYVIEPSEAVRDSLVPPLDVASTKTVLFRLADTIVDSGAAMCATQDAPITTGRDSYDALKRELNALKGGPAVMQALSAALRLEISAIGDGQFRAQFTSDAQAIDQMLLRLNNVDGIFASELGIQIQVPTARVYDTATDPLPTTTAPNDLLRRLASLRLGSPELKARGLTHLFTGRDLDGATVGIGYIDSLCNAEFGAALTEIRGRGAWLESLISAHEIGHNFGAVHDGEDACSAVPQNQFLMSPTVYASNATFSSCSLGMMTSRVASASCITTLPPADLSIAADLGTVREGVGRAFEWELPVTNVGGRTMQNARIEVLVPATLTVVDAWIPGGTCTSGAGVIDCELGGIAGGVTRALHLTLQAASLGQTTISARLVALADARTTNNEGNGTIVIEPERDLGITLQAPAAVVAGDSFMATFAISNTAPEDAQSVAITFTLPSNVRASAANLANGTCDLETLACSLTTLAAGANVEGTLTLSASSSGTATVSARVSGAAFDPNTPNDIATQSITVSPAATNAATSEAKASSGGGGSFGLPFALALLALRRRSKRSA